ncbi:DNA-binding response regulator [Labilibaculum manganireducens]|uniref:DNA-binding response regulator n=1 Tax=Labilibaculum manganireducens TaxID=1940525 RepID=A0A2N3HXB4_9BACT|nr:LytTR family DNA-binding domain-containing protein [Labilibaculum manganireducens]PKQ62673.1 DNA-binding response regulator [Labilibaculum manganireducens]
MINCIAIDDEPLALKQITGYIEKTAFLNLKASFENAMDALQFIAENKIDLIFLDIHMPDLNGMDMAKSLDNRPKIIFTTAYSEYAIDGFKVNALDYILKPLDYTTFLKSALKAQMHLDHISSKTEDLNANSDHLFIKSEYKIIRIEIKNILYIEGMREYVRIHLDNTKPLMTLLSMKKIEEKLPSSPFMRVHRSFIVNLQKITTIERSRIIFNDVYIPISDQYKEKFQHFIDNNFLI